MKRTLEALRGAFNKSSSQQTNVKGSDPNMTEILRGNLFDGVQNWSRNGKIRPYAWNKTAFYLRSQRLGFL